MSDYFADGNRINLLSSYKEFVESTPYAVYNHNPKKVINFVKLKTGLKHEH